MKVLFPDQKSYLISGSILLSNIYYSLGYDDQATIMRSDRKRNYGNKVKPGLSWTEQDGEIVVKSPSFIINISKESIVFLAIYSA